MFSENPGPEQVEEKNTLKKYTYRDNSNGRAVVFECVATNILEADKLYQKETGKDVVKQSYIGCSVEKAKEENRE